MKQETKKKHSLELYTIPIAIIIGVYGWMQKTNFGLTKRTQLIFILSLIIFLVGFVSSVIRWYKGRVK